MTYDARERSEEDAAPIELYEFLVYDQLYLFTTAAEDQTISLKTYSAEGMKRSDPEASTEIPKQNLTINTRPDHPMTQFYAGNPPSAVVLLRIFRYHRDDTDPQPFWAGRVLNCDWIGGEAVFYCESIYTSLRRTGLRRLYGRGCPYELYGNECNVVEADHRTAVILTAVTGNQLEGVAFGSQADGKFIGGFLDFEPVPGTLHRRAIIAHATTLVTITHAIPGIAVNDTIQAHIGCERNITDCDATFTNIENYGGLAPFMQKLNPFGGGNVF